MKKTFAEFVKSEPRPYLLIVCGLPGSWKTETCEEVAKFTGYPILRTDLIRLEVLKGEDVFDQKVAANMDKRVAVYEEMFRQADKALEGHEGVILDATFVTQALRKRAGEIAAKHNRKLIVMQTDCPQGVSIRRILARTRENYESNALDEQAYLNNKKKFEQVDLDDLKKSCPGVRVTHFVVDTHEDPPGGWTVSSVKRK